MDAEHPLVDSHRLSRVARKMRGRKAYRDSYVASHTRQFLARQMREFRGDQSQTEFGALLDKQQTVVSRLEDPNYGKWTLQTLFDVASKLEVAVVVRFVDFPTFLGLTNDRSKAALSPASYDQAKVDEFVSKKEDGQSAARKAYEAMQDDIYSQPGNDLSPKMQQSPPAANEDNSDSLSGLRGVQR
jgi:hypothetical protein